MLSITLRAGLQMIYISRKEKEMGKKLCILIKLVRENEESCG
jgi:hypothetical protein